jgi:GntR family transcriptional regulator
MEPQATAGERAIKIRIADDIRMRIERGELPPGAPIPTIQELTEKWDTSPRTARDAHALLRQMGLVTGSRGAPLRVRTRRRMTVRDSERHQLEKDLVLRPEAERAQTGTSELEMGTSIDAFEFHCVADRWPADQLLASALEVALGTDLLRRTFEKTDKRTGALHEWSVSYIPVELIKGNPEIIDKADQPWPGGTQHQLYTVGIEVMRIVDEVTSAMPTTVDLQRWELDEGVPLLRVRRISIDDRDRVVEVSDAVFPADRTKLVFTTPLKKWPSERSGN